ncbi:MAG TPA: glycosyltransferase N-terminal domain-containing protein, partial [Candidatus Sumerlaeota bacterium]|nr:glycosyltransferase N-terminal domain-containing protein [Candidatus Sumerlaeota bacterium]
MTGADLLYLMAAPFFAPPFLYKMLVRGKYRLSSRGMLGLDLKGEPWGSRDAVAPRLWLHAVSVGEVVAGKAILAEWARFRPDTRIVASTVTETGQQKARDLLTEADEFTFFPLDLTPVVTRFLNWYDPQVYVMMETEIWPNFLRQAARRGTKVFLANGKLSDSSFRRWERFHKLLQGTFDAITAAAVQTEQDREKFVRLLGRPDDVLVTGNCKFDSSGTPITPAEHAGFLDRLRIPTDAPVIVAGSTHPGEEEIVLNAWTAVRGRIPDCRLILAPRHPERFDAVAR